MSYSVVFAREAESDLAGIIDHISRDNPRRAHIFADDLRKFLMERLSVFPESGPSIGTRRYVVFGNYVIVYRLGVEAKTVYVQLITEGHRNWRRAFETPE